MVCHAPSFPPAYPWAPFLRPGPGNHKQMIRLTSTDYETFLPAVEGT